MKQGLRISDGELQATPARPSDHPSARIAWLDTARGLGIVLVVIGHALGGLIDSPLGQGQDGFRRAFFAIYTFHMPLFFLLSGLLITRRLEKGAGTFVRGLLPTVVWPYFLWLALQFTVIFALGSLVNSPAHSYWPVILSLPWNTVSQFWFLYALFWMHMLAVLLLPRVGREGLVLFALALKALVLILPMPVPVKLVCSHAFFYAIGVWLTPAGIDAILLRHRAAIRALLVPLLAIGIIAATLAAAPDYGRDLPLLTASSPQISNLAWRFPAMTAAIFGVAGLLGIASLPRLAAMHWLAVLGRMTMPIFVLHVMFIAGTRIVLTRFGLIDDPQLLLAIIVVAGLAGPLIAERITRALGLNRYLGF